MEEQLVPEVLRLLAVHAHPDDESSKGAATLAKYVAQGARVIVATCTGGERGSVLNPALQGGAPPPPLPAGCFALEPLETAAAPLVRLMREFRPHVVTTYDENGGYPPPDHVMCHKITIEAFEAAAEPARHPPTGEPWQPPKLYYHPGFH